MSLTHEIVRDVDRLAPLAEVWTELAGRTGQPLSTWAWTRAWWEHLRPERAEPRVVVVRDGDRVVAIAPWFVDDPGARRVDYRFMGSGFLGVVGPFATPEAVWDAAGEVAAAFASMTPRPGLITFEGVDLRSPWPTLLRERWTGALRPSAFRPRVHSAPSVTLGQPDVDAWLATRSPGFRSHLRRMRRQLEKAGGRIRPATAQTLQADLEAMFALHAGRWAGRGRSAFSENRDAVVRMLAQVGRTELATHGLQLWVVELDGAPIAVQLFASADRTAVLWNGGWDERHARLSPGMLAILAGIGSAIERGVGRLDLGAGAQPYKLRFADGSVPNAWGHLVVPGRRIVGTSMTLTGPAARSVATRFARRSLPGDRLDQLRRMRGRLGIG